MQKQEVLKHFGGVIKTAEALGMSKGGVSQWGHKVPFVRAYQIEQITKGKLKAEIDDYVREKGTRKRYCNESQVQ